jgi:hypothetical protein
MIFLKRLLKIIIFIPVSWVLCHLAAFFSIFVSVSYPILWLILPSQTVCFNCRVLELGNTCSICKSKVKQPHPTMPKNFRSALINSFIIFVISVISMGLVLFESKILESFGFVVFNRSAEIFIPEKSEHFVGEVFPLNIELINLSTSINVVRMDIAFDPTLLKAIDITTEGSFSTIFVDKEINNDLGYAQLIGGLPNPGFNGKDGFFASVIFEAVDYGVTQIEFLPTSSILENNGQGTDILSEFGTVSYIILPKENNVIPSSGLKKNSLIASNTLPKKYNDSTQLKFYEHTSVLGASTSASSDALLPVDKSSSLENQFVIILKRLARFAVTLDEIIVNFWKKLFRYGN